MTPRSRATVAPEATFLLLAAAWCAAALSVPALQGYADNPRVLAPAVLLDLALGLPVLGYLVLVRMGGRRPTILIPLGLAGLALAAWRIPEAHLDLSSSLEAAVLVFEGLLLVLLIGKARRARAAFRAARSRVPYRIDAARSALSDVLGRRLGAAVFSEVGVLIYALAGWRPRRRAHAWGPVFTGYRRSGYSAILVAILMAVVVETLAVHLLVALWSEPVAWVLTLFGGYSASWMLGDYHAARLNPSIASDRAFHVRTGLRWRADIAWDRIVAVHAKAPADEGLKLTMWGAPDLWIECAAPVEVEGPFGIVRRARVLGLAVDERDRFQEAYAART